MTSGNKHFLYGMLEGLEKAQEIVNRRSVDPATIRWLAREIENLKKDIERDEEE